MTITKQQMIEWISKVIGYESNGLGDDFFQPIEETEKELAVMDSIRAHLQSAVVVREGFKVVPCEPTREMWAASGDAQYKRYGGFNVHHDVVTECVWAALIAAAPDYREEE